MAATQVNLTVTLTPKGAETTDTFDLMDFLSHAKIDHIDKMVSIKEKQYDYSTLKYFTENVVQ